jgi:N-acetylneuraminic acid mutarotase
MKSVYVKPVRYALLCSLFISASCERDPSSSTNLTGNWHVAADFKGDTRSEAAAFVIDNTAYVLTGVSAANNGAYGDMFAFDVDNNSWTQLPSLPGQPRNGCVAFSINGKGYIGTGANDKMNMQDIWEYNPGTKTWTEKDPMPGDARYDATSFVINGKAYICGGFNGRKAFNDTWEFDPSQPAGQQWIERASFPSKTRAAVAFVLDNKGYMVTGSNSSGEIQKELYQYDPPPTNKWTTKRPLYNFSNESYDDRYTSIVRHNAVAFVQGGYAFIATGENGPYVTSTWGYKADTDTWTEFTSFENKPRDGAVAFVVKDRCFVLTGKNGALYMDNTFEFNPFVEKVSND